MTSPKVIRHFCSVKLAIFLVIWLSVGLTINLHDQRAFNLQQMGVDAIVTHGTFTLGHSDVPTLKPLGDTFHVEKGIVPAKQPGQFVAGAIAYAPIKAFGLRYEDNYELTATLVTFLSASLLSAIALLFFYQLLRLWAFAHKPALYSTLSVALCSHWLVYAGIAHHDIIAASFLILALYCSEKSLISFSGKHTRLSVLTGVFAGLVVFTSMLPALIILAFGLYILFSRKLPHIMLAGCGFALGLLPLALYNTYYFGNPLTQANIAGNYADTFFQFKAEQFFHHLNAYLGWGGLSIWKYAPIIAIGFLGVILLPKIRWRVRLFVVLACTFHMVYLLSIETMGTCQYAPRYLIPLVPLCAIGLAPLVAWVIQARSFEGAIVLGAITGYSLLVSFVGAWGGAMQCDLDNFMAFRYLADAGKWQLMHWPLFWPALIGLAGCGALFLLTRYCVAPIRQHIDTMSQTVNSMKKPYRFLFPLFVGLLLIMLHAYDVENIPAGFYLDETSIGLNAAGIATSGTDEYGTAFPIYFRAFGEWKNPLYIYASSGVMYVFGVSEWSLRITSVLFYGVFLWGVWAFSKLVFPGQPRIGWYALIAAGTLPWFFTLSRISFEVISQITTGIWLLYFLYLAYSAERKTVYAAPAGLLLALFLYSYSTSKVLAFGILLALAIAFYQKQYWKAHGVLVLSFCLCMIPYLWFSLQHPGALSGRFEMLTYLYKNDLSIIDKISMFLRNYVSAFDLSSFQLFKGDPNTRHSTGFMGQFFVIPFCLGLVGVGKLAVNAYAGTAGQKQWSLFIILLILGAGAPAALTTDMHHSLRLLFLGLMIFVASCYGCAVVLTAFNDKKNRLFGGIVLGIAVQSFFYFEDYFTAYKQRSVGAFAGYEMQQAIAWTETQPSRNTLFYEALDSGLYASLGFYNAVLQTDVKLSIDPIAKDTCYLWYVWNQPKTVMLPVSSYNGDPKGIIRAACY